MTTKAELIEARQAGLAAEPGASNPYAGLELPTLGLMWRHGYRQMLADRLATSPARQAYLQNRDRAQ